MNPLYPLFRLGWRWRVPFILVWMGLMLAVIPIGELFMNKISPFDVTSFDQLSRPAWIALWRCVFGVPATFAVIVTWLTAEFRMGLDAWTLPDVRKSLTAGMVFVAAVSALPIPLLIARMGYPNTGVVAFFIGLFAFAAVCRIVDVFMKHIPSMVIFLVGLLLAYRGGTTGDLALAYPWVAGLLALIVAIYCFALEYLPTTARMRVRPAEIQWEAWRLPRLRKASDDLPIWNRSLARAGTIGWVFAGFYENYPSDFARLWTFLSPLLIILFYSNFLAMPKENEQQFIVAQLMFLSTINFLLRPPVLGRSLLYPVSRERRALITFWGCIGATIGLMVILLASMCIAAMLSPVTSLLGVSWAGVGIAARELPLLFGWTPVLVWLYVRYAKRAGRVPIPRLSFPMMLAGMAVFFPGAIIVFDEAERGLSVMTAAFVTLLIVLVQILHWRLLKRFFATADLVWAAGET